jgi:hypothetical protein
MPDYGYGALALGSGAGEGLATLLKQRLMERAQQLAELTQRQTAAHNAQQLAQQGEATAAAREATSAYRAGTQANWEAAQADRDATEQRQDRGQRQSAFEKFAANSPDVTPVPEQYMDLPPQRPEVSSPGFDATGTRGITLPKFRAMTAVPPKPDPGVKSPAALAQEKELITFRAQTGAQYRPPQTTTSFPLPPMPGPGIDPLANEDPATKATVKAILDYKYPMPTGGFAMRDPNWKRIIGLAMQADPSFDATQYPARQSLRRDATSGKTRNTIVAINTLVGHLDTLHDKMSALKNTSIQPLNWVKNTAASATGSAAPTGFRTTATAVENEMATVLKQTGATDQEIKQWREVFGMNLAPDQQRELFRTAIEIMGSRLGAIKDQYERGMGRPVDFNMLTPTSRKILSKYGIDMTTLGATGPRQPISDNDILR